MLSFRLGTDADLATVTAIETAPETARWLCETGRNWHVLAFVDPAQEHVLAVDPDGTVVGFGVLAGLHRDDKALEVRRIAIAEEHTGRGHGRALLRELVARAYTVHRARRVWLDVKPGNDRAHGLYISEGFADEHTETAPFTEADGTPTELVVMGHRPGLDRFAAALDEIVVNCAEPYPLAVFWSRVLGGEPVDRDPAWAYVDAPNRPRLAFQRVPEPKQPGRNRLHLDVLVTDIPAATEALELIGAAREGKIVRDALGAFQILLDPEGNEFCLVTG
ncbi:GNAT family N-acetyltransferase [Yinghuangia soli]|uniref:GNAT family N-acetyltransferase n=1 Tax=Yinghuangia soli TaxID=2908204 RepID=A0AA41Q714_9ACTN|nr:GNAT family N-acetyltransferase [Yinghuangia soli]MCF2532743.1 GNAT family N-acetyltransferase [Yinghuangia soli]